MQRAGCSLATIAIAVFFPGAVPVAAETAKIYTEDAATAGAGVVEFELTASHTRRDLRFEDSGEQGRKGEARVWLWELAFSYGLSESLDLGVGLSWEDLHENGGDPSAGDGFGDSFAALKWNFGRLGRWDLGYVGGLTLPTGDESDERDLGPGTGLTTLDQLFVGTLEAAQWTLSADAGFALPINENRHGERTSWLADFAAGWQLREPLQLLAELNYRRDETENDGNAEILAVTAGFTWQLNEIFRVDASATHGVWGDQASSTRAARLNLLGAL